MIFLHPDIYLDQRWDTLDWIEQIEYEGLVMMPRLTANTLRNMIKKHDIKNIYIKRNRLEENFTLSPCLKRKDTARTYIIFSLTKK